MKRLFRFRYPKIAILIAFMAIAYILFSDSNVSSFVNNIGTYYEYIGYFFAGLLFSFGFTTPFSVGYLIVSKPDNIFLASIMGGVGALISDIVIFKIIKFSFIDEFQRLKRTERIRELRDLIEYEFGHKIKNYLLYIFAGIVIASPLPDELGVIMLAGLTKIRIRSFMVISFLFNTIGIFIILLI
ncbi:hypothetical protein J4218_01940 [Candidatus Pacearchaeota archaeon]|nr:hypothetical protein [uncultured archaeon]MBS3078858.1 hypothetical protein [Candidatus Pacearchaeota archaeon]